jgi:hypothetical protein
VQAPVWSNEIRMNDRPLRPTVSLRWRSRRRHRQNLDFRLDGPAHRCSVALGATKNRPIRLDGRLLFLAESKHGAPDELIRNRLLALLVGSVAVQRYKDHVSESRKQQLDCGDPNRCTIGCQIHIHARSGLSLPHYANALDAIDACMVTRVKTPLALSRVNVPPITASMAVCRANPSPCPTADAVPAPTPSSSTVITSAGVACAHTVKCSRRPGRLPLP